MNPLNYASDMTYLEKIERQAAIARAEEAARFVGDVYDIGRAAFHALARALKPANDDDDGRHAA